MTSIFDLEVPKIYNKKYKLENNMYKKNLKKLISVKNIDINTPDVNGNSLLMNIAKTDNLELFKDILDDYKIDINQSFNNCNDCNYPPPELELNEIARFETVMESALYYCSWNIVDYLLTYTDVKYEEIWSCIRVERYDVFKSVNCLYYTIKYGAPAGIISKIFNKYKNEDLFMTNDFDDSYLECLITLIRNKDVLKVIIYNLTDITKNQIVEINKKIVEFDKIQLVNDEGISSSLQKIRIVTGCNCSLSDSENGNDDS